MAATDDEDEWEYEYDEEETEDIYITVDFSTFTPPAIPTRAPGPLGGNRNGPHKQSRNARLKTQPAATTDTPSPTPSTPTATSDQLQILSLHTTNPLISFNSQIYTCHWATDIGTALHISAPDPSHSALRSLPSFDLLAKTRTRLVAVPARLKSLSPSVPNPAPPPDPNQSWSIATAEGDTLTYDAAGRLHIAVPANAGPGKAAQARFLARWAELKAARGRPEPVPVKTIRGYKLPEGWREERRAWLAEDNDEAATEGLAPRRRRRAGVMEDWTEEERRVRFRTEE